jgi:uncharacterized membrane protein
VEKFDINSMRFNLKIQNRKVGSQSGENALARHILKTISYRILGSLVTVITALCLGVSIELSSLLGVVELVIKPIIYFTHERFWYNFLTIRNK